MSRNHYSQGCRFAGAGAGAGTGAGTGMLLTSQESEQLMTGFLTTRLSYEAFIHKNESVSYDRCFIIPKGKRSIVWITEWKRMKVVAVIEIVQGHQAPTSSFHRKFQQENGWIPGALRLYDACVDDTLAYGTVFGGTVFRIHSKTYFSIHYIYWYKGDSIPLLTLSDHVRLCERIFYENDIRQIAYTKHNSILFGLPVLCYSTENIDAVIEKLPYTVFAIQYRSNSTTRVYQQLYNPNTVHAPTVVPVPTVVPTVVTNEVVSTPELARKWFIQPPDEMLTNIQAIFVVRPNIQNDVYELFVRPASASEEFVFHNFAHIPNYKTSVMMNGYFRTIAENKRLDALEESDDEADFENTEPDKYVSLEKEFLMICRFNKRFCRWVPIQMLSSTKTKTIPLDRIINYQQVKQHESKYISRSHKRV